MKQINRKEGFTPLEAEARCEPSRPLTGFTLIEILVVIGIIAILATVVLVAINPARQFAQAHNSQRTSNVSSILDAIGQNIADNKGVFTCPTYTLTATPTDIKKGSADIRPCIVPTYISEIPSDPLSAVANTCTDAACSAPGTYDTNYNVSQDATTKRITVSAPNTELGGSLISITR